MLSVWVVFWSLIRHSPSISQAHERGYGAYLELIEKLLVELAREEGFTIIVNQGCQIPCRPAERPIQAKLNSRSIVIFRQRRFRHYKHTKTPRQGQDQPREVSPSRARLALARSSSCREPCRWLIAIALSTLASAAPWWPAR